MPADPAAATAATSRPDAAALSALPDTTPVLVGQCQLTQRDHDPATALSPLGLLEAVARGAAADSGAADPDALARALDCVAVVRTFPDTAPRWNMAGADYTNLPRSLANRLGAPARQVLYSTAGGNTPQYMVNVMAERIQRGEAEAVVLAGAEALATAFAAARQGLKLDWGDDPGGSPEPIGDARPYMHPSEMAHLIARPIHIYPMMELALAHRHGRTLDAHMAEVGRLFARFSRQAAANPLAVFRTERSAAELVTPGPANRYVGFPYPKYLNAMVYIDQAAAVVLTSVGLARRHGIPTRNWVFLHGSSDAHDTLIVSERPELSGSPAIRATTRQALDQAGIPVERIDGFDIYSCFPVAVEVACESMGIGLDDPRPLTLTGGLPYFGGPGNNYSMHGIAEMIRFLRARTRPSFGMVTANGGYLTKQSVGVYANIPADRPFARPDQAALQAELDALPHPEVDWTPAGAGVIETVTVAHDRDGQPEMGLVIGRLAESGCRFIARPPTDPATLEGLKTLDSIGRPGAVTAAATEDGLNLFVPA